MTHALRTSLIVAAAVAAAVPAQAQSKREMQMMADLRMLQEQSQQLQVSLDAAQRRLVAGAEGPQHQARRAEQRDAQSARRLEPQDRSVGQRSPGGARGVVGQQREDRPAVAGSRSAAHGHPAVPAHAGGSRRPPESGDPSAAQPPGAASPPPPPPHADLLAAGRHVAAETLRHRLGRLHRGPVGPVHFGFRSVSAGLPAERSGRPGAVLHRRVQLSGRQASGGRPGVHAGDRELSEGSGGGHLRTTSAGWRSRSSDSSTALASRSSR